MMLHPKFLTCIMEKAAITVLTGLYRIDMDGDSDENIWRTGYV